MDWAELNLRDFYAPARARWRDELLLLFADPDYQSALLSRWGDSPGPAPDSSPAISSWFSQAQRQKRRPPSSQQVYSVSEVPKQVVQQNHLQHLKAIQKRLAVQEKSQRPRSVSRAIQVALRPAAMSQVGFRTIDQNVVITIKQQPFKKQKETKPEDKRAISYSSLHSMARLQQESMRILLAKKGVRREGSVVRRKENRQEERGRARVQSHDHPEQKVVSLRQIMRIRQM